MILVRERVRCLHTLMGKVVESLFSSSVVSRPGVSYLLVCVCVPLPQPLVIGSGRELLGTVLAWTSAQQPARQVNKEHRNRIQKCLHA